MEETLKKLTSNTTDSKGKSVILCIRSGLTFLEGSWQWDMVSDALYCSDVMAFPADFEGTKGLIHPDDLTNVSSALNLLEDKGTLRLEFRIITTYGEVKKILGHRIAIKQDKEDAVEEQEKEPWLEATQQIAARRETEYLQVLKDLFDTAEKLNGAGTWFINKDTNVIYYSNNVYRIHGLPANSLNAHAHTFNLFIHPEDRVTVIDALENAYAQELPIHLEYRIVKPNGEVRYVQQVTQWSFNNKGQLILKGILQDITEQKEQSEKLTTVENLLRLHQQALQFTEQQTSSGYWYTDLITRKTTFSDNYLRIYGLKNPVLPNYTVALNLVHPDDKELVAASIEKLYKEHTLADIEFRIIRPDGKLRYLQQSAKSIVHNGAELIILGFVQDITAQKLLELKMQEQNETYELLKTTYSLVEDTAKISSIVWYLPEENMTWSDGFYTLLGYKPGAVEPSQRLLQKSIDPRDLKVFKDTIVLALNGQTTSYLFIRLITKTGIKQVKISLHTVTFNNKTAVTGIVHDVSESLSVQQQLTSEVRLNQLLKDSVKDCVILTNQEHTIINWNSQAEQRVGIKESEALNKNIFDVFPALKKEDFLSHLQTALTGEQVMIVQARNGYLKGPYSYTLTPYKNEEGTVIGVLHLVQDISKELDLQQRLNERLNFIESLVEASMGRIVVLDRNMNYLYWNKRAEEYYAINKQRVIGKNILEIFPAFRNDPGYQEFRKVLRGETVHIPPAFSEENNEYAETYLTPIKDETGVVTAILWAVHDKSKEYELIQEQERAGRMLDTIQEMFIELDEAGKIKYVNKQAEESWQKKREDLLGQSIWEVFPEAINTSGYDIITKALAEKTIVQGEYFSTILQRWTQMSAIPSAEGVIVLFYNISALKQTEQELKENKDLLQAVFDVSPNSISVLNTIYDKSGQAEDFEILMVNHITSTFTGGKDIIGARVSQVFPNTIKNGLLEKFRKVATTGEPAEFELWYNEEGMNHWFCIFVCKLNHLLIVTIEDITKRKIAETSLQEAKDFVEQIALTTPDLITIHDAATNKIIYTNHNFFWPSVQNSNEVYDMEDVRRLAALIHPDDHEKAKNFLKERRQLADDEVKEVELKMVDNSDWIRIRSKIFQRDENGKATQIISFTTNINNSKKAEEEIKKNLAILQYTEELTQTGSWEYNIATGSFNWSEGMYHLFGVPDGTNVTPDIYLDFSLPEDSPIAKRIVKNIKTGCRSFEETMRIKIGNMVRLLKIKGSVVQNESGAAQKVVGVDVDITEMQQAKAALEKNEEHLRNLLDAIPQSMWTALPDGYGNFHNKKWFEYSGVAPDGKIDGNWLNAFHPDDRDRTVALWKACLAEGREYVNEVRIKHISGEYRWNLAIAKPIKDEKGTITLWVGTHTDIHDVKMIEERLKELNRSLEHKNNELEDKNEELTSFAFVASHDLREPLRKIHTFSNLLLETESTGLSNKGQDYLNRLNGAVKRMGALIDDILTLSRVHKTDKVEVTVELNEIVAKTKQELQEVITATGATIEAADLPVIKGNPAHLLYLFKNIISNGIKFQKEGNKPVIKIRAQMVQGKDIDELSFYPDTYFIKLSFSDNGIGFDPAYAKKIFQVFQRLHGLHEYPGTGMGLAICKKIMENHNGCILAESQPGEGATFSCYFPVSGSES